MRKKSKFKEIFSPFNFKTLIGALVVIILFFIFSLIDKGGMVR